MTIPTRTTSGPTTRRTWWVVGIVGVLLMIALAVWFGIAATAGRVHWVNTGFVVTQDDELQVRFDVIRDPSREVVCELHALDGRHTRVGTATVTVPPSDRSPSRHTEMMRTASRAVTGYVDTCAYPTP